MVCTACGMIGADARPDWMQHRAPGMTAGAHRSCLTSVPAESLGGELNKVVHATLSKDRTTGSGVGTFPGGNIFTMSKL